MAVSRTILVAGAGLGGLTAALALAKRGFRAEVFEQSTRLEEIGAGIQLSPNAMHVLLALGLEEALRPHVVSAECISVRKGSSGRELARVPLGLYAERRYGAPYWMIHRSDLQKVLIEAARANPDISVQLGSKVRDFAVHANGVTAQVQAGYDADEKRGIALVAADGLWSALRRRLGHLAPPRFARRTAWRATVAADAVPYRFTEPCVDLWLGRHAHLVHYPVKAGREINIVAIVRDEAGEPGWSREGARKEIVSRFRRGWAIDARNMVATPEQWSRWALYDCAPLDHWGEGPVTLLGDAAHAMLPFLAQGAAMAIEDAIVLAESLAALPDDPARAMRHYEGLRRDRTARAQREARRNGRRYHASGIEAALRNLALRGFGGKALLWRYRWLYGWGRGVSLPAATAPRFDSYRPDEPTEE
ncbi:MAG TPA: FAD-dependent monooxygenase [Xanthobacteraceae bacterium]|nr:FAD-dependent monooxygenase [Xanthobacteraceae bacterium]